MDGAGFIGPFEIRGKLGRGAMAVVWRGYDPSLDREVAIKEPLLPPESSDDVRLEFASRFIREGRAAARLNHPGIVTIYSAAAYDQRPVIVMELIEGPTLRTVLKGGRLTTRQTFALLDELMLAVGYAHEHGVTHRDLKPDNIFITRNGTVKLADFGIAQLASGSTIEATSRNLGSADGPALTRAGTLLGTPAYMSPERIRGETVDARCDVFALGVIAYECLTGANPFGSESSTHYATIIHRIMSEPTPPLQLTDSVAGSLSGIIMKALEKQRENRFENAVAMLSAWRTAAPSHVDAKAELAALCGAVAGRAAAPTPNPTGGTKMWGVDAARASAPVTTLRGADDAWHASDVMLEFAAEGADSIATHVQHRLDDGPWMDGDALVVRAQAGGANDGVHTVTYRAIDAAGLVETPQTAQVRIDTVPPATTLRGADDAWHTTDVTLELMGRDEQSGVAVTEYRVDDGPWTVGTRFVARAAEDGSNDGAHSFDYRSLDNAGNVEAEQRVVVRVDAGAPVTEVTGADETWQAKDVRLRFAAHDAHSGVAMTEYRIDDGPWVKGDAAAVRASRDGRNDGEHVVRYRSTDAAGNVEVERATRVRIDATPPVTTVEGGDDSRHDGQAILRFAATDAYSGVARTEYRIDNRGWVQGTTVTLPESPAGVHTVEFRSVDGAGNVEAARKMVIETRGAPTPPAIEPAPRLPRKPPPGRRRAIILVALLAVAVAVAGGVAAFALTRQNGADDAARQNRARQQAQLAAAQEEATALSPIDQALGEGAATYATVVKSAQKKAAQNEQDLADWQKEWDERLAAWEKEKAAVNEYNANRPSTPAQTKTRTTKVWDSFSESWVYKTETYTVPGTTAPPKATPPKPHKPKAVQASVQSERKRIESLTTALTDSLDTLDSLPATPQLARARDSIRSSLVQLRGLATSAHKALSNVIRTSDKGDVIKRGPIASLSTDGLGDVDTAHQALLDAVKALGPAAVPVTTPATSPGSP